MGIACPFISEAALGYAWGKQELQTPQFLGSHAQHKPQASQRVGVPESTEAVGAAGEGKAIPGPAGPRAGGLGTAKLGRL